MGADFVFAAETFTKTERVKEPPKIYRDGSIGLGVNDPLFQFKNEQGPKRSEKYEEIGVLGTGSYGQAVLVRRRSDGVKMVVKQIKIHGLSFEQRLDARNEVEVLSKLDHPNIVRYHECFLEGGILQIVMEYADEGDLYGRIQKASERHAPFSEEQVMFWFVQICLALKHVHAKRMLHRDLKTQNIFCSAHDLLKLGDFGIAKVLSDDKDMAKTVIGTPYYLSPEICEDKPYDKKSDVWSLGCVLYEMVTLKHAFDGQSLPALVMKILRGKYPPIPASYSANLKHLIGSMLTRDPKHRPSIEKILSLPFVRAAIERYCDHIQRYIINHGSAESALQESSTESANQSSTESTNQGLVEGLSGATDAKEEIEEGLAEDLSGPLEAIREGTLEGTAFLDKLPAPSSVQEGADVRTPNGGRPASPGSEKLARARALARQKSAGRNQEWLAQQEAQLQVLTQQVVSPGTGINRESFAKAPLTPPNQRPIQDLFSELVEEQLNALPSPLTARGRPPPSPPLGKRPGARAALQVGTAVRKARTTRGQSEAAERQKSLESASRKALKGLDSPGTKPASRDANSLGSRPASRDANSVGRRTTEEPKKGVKKALSPQEKERQRRLQDKETRRVKEAQLIAAQELQRQNRKEDLVRQQAERKSAREAELLATKQHLQKHKDALKQAKPRLNKLELMRQFSAGAESPAETKRSGDFDVSLRGSTTNLKDGGQTSPKPPPMLETLKTSPYGKSVRRPLSSGGGFARGSTPASRSRKIAPEDLPVEIYVRGYTGPVVSQGCNAKRRTAVQEGKVKETNHELSSSWRKVKGGLDLIAVLHTMQHHLSTHKGPLVEEEEPPPAVNMDLGVIQEADDEGTPFSTIKANSSKEKEAPKEAPLKLPSPKLQVRTRGEKGHVASDRVAALLSESGVPMTPMTPTVGEIARSSMGAKIEALRKSCENQLEEEAFVRVYKYLRDVHQNEEDSTVHTQARLESILNQDQLPLVRHVYKLVMYEDDFYGGHEKPGV